uniref:eCIS core domain-containing protein n=1 Tax=Natrialba hulunbeirensis TaxID=123783 RepID=UPI000AC24089
MRIHTGAKAAEAADAIDAKAFTCGNDVVFNSGEYDPESSEGQFLLAHELAHVKQQNGGATISMMPQEGADLEIDPDPQLEREADEAAAQALTGDVPLVVNRMGTDVHIQRSAKGESEYVTRGEVYEIVQNHYEGVVRNQAEQDPLEAGPERETPGNSAGKSTQVTDDGGFFSNAWEKTKQVGSDLSQAVTKGSIGSLVGAGGKAVGMVGGASLGAFLGGALGSFAGPMGTAAGAAVGSKLGETIGGELLGGAASDAAKQLTEYTFPKQHSESVQELQQKYESLKEEVEELKKADPSTSSDLEGVGKSGMVTKQ